MSTFRLGRAWSLRSTTLLAALTLAITACTLPAGGTSPADEGPSSTRPPAIRVNQAGYAVGEAKQAFVMGSELSRAGYRVVDEHGTTVTTGRVGARTGSWSSKYPAVHLVDLSGLDTPGNYHVELTGTASGSSPMFRIAPAAQLLTPLSRTTSVSSRPSATARTCFRMCCTASPHTWRIAGPLCTPLPDTTRKATNCSTRR